MTFVKEKLSKVWLLTVFAAAIFVSPKSNAQQNTAYPEGMEPRQAIGGILMAGLVGGILGLSTLSFYDRPQDNIRNITIGAGIGMIASALYLTYNVSQVPPPKAHLDLKEGEVYVAGALGQATAAPAWSVYPAFDPVSSTTGVGLQLSF